MDWRKRRMTPKELLSIVKQNRLLGSEKPRFDICTLKIDPKPCLSSEGVRQALQDFHPEQGWLCFQSKLTRFLPNEPLPDAGVLLYGEVKNKDGSSLHIQQDGEGGWILTYYHEQSNGDTYLAENVLLIAETYPDDPRNTRYDLKYRVFWGALDYGQEDDDGQGWRQIAAAFNGFEKIEQKVNPE
jgi:hypothetical protein